MPLPHAGNRGHDLTGRTVAALQGIMIDERLLHGMERSVSVGNTLDGDDVPAFNLCHRGQAGCNAPTVDMDRTCTALAMITALLSPEKRQRFAQGIKQRDAWIMMEGERRAIQREAGQNLIREGSGCGRA